MQKMVVSLAIMFAILVPATSFAQGQKEINQQVAEAIADKLTDKYPEYPINVRYNSGVATLTGELYSAAQVNEAAAYVQSLPGVSRVIHDKLTVVQSRTQIQAMPTSTRLGNNVIQQPVSEAPSVSSAVTQPAAPVVTQSTSSAIAQVSGQMQGVTDFSQQQAPVRTPVAPAIAAAPAVMAPAPTLAPATPAPNFAAVAPAAPLATSMAQASYVDAPQDLGTTDFAPPFSGQATITTAPAPTVAGGSNFSGMPMPMSAQVPTAGRYDQPNVPNYAWPAYAAPNNYAEVAYPKLYCPQAAPYIGPFYPYPQVPMGWRKVTLEWHDGYWWLDFDDGTANGPFSPLFRQPNPKRY